ncbi:MAG: MerR family transcriptional regulator [Candidatus Eisenbacteria bacterium]|nr:MerR family transcriptional regulator [Candidatus Eisenbacteria bacterium]
MPETAPRLSKPYYSISEVATITEVKAHVLRYWETQFSMLRPRKNRAGNRMYRPQDIEFVLYLKDLLYERRFTIQGAKQKILTDKRTAHADPEVREQVEMDFRQAGKQRLLGEVRQGLENLLKELKKKL